MARGMVKCASTVVHNSARPVVASQINVESQLHVILPRGRYPSISTILWTLPKGIVMVMGMLPTSLKVKVQMPYLITQVKAKNPCGPHRAYP